MQGGKAVDFIERTALDAQVSSSDEVRNIAARVQNQATYPNSHLAQFAQARRQAHRRRVAHAHLLRLAGRLRHAHQPDCARSSGCWQTSAIPSKAFVDDLKAQGNMQRVLVMTFSEFGRRVAENANGGTDHGAAAPMFIVGNKVKAGLLGRYPSLAPQDLFQGDIKYNVDFRSVYAGVLENWLKTKSAPILGRQFEPLQVV